MLTAEKRPVIENEVGEAPAKLIDDSARWISANDLYDMANARKAWEAFVVRATCDRQAFY